MKTEKQLRNRKIIYGVILFLFIAGLATIWAYYFYADALRSALIQFIGPRY